MDRVFWIRVNDVELNGLNVAHRQYNLKLRLDAMGKVKQLEQKLFGLHDNFLAVFCGQEVKLAAAGSELLVVELSGDALPDSDFPTYQVNDHSIGQVPRGLQG